MNTARQGEDLSTMTAGALTATGLYRRSAIAAGLLVAHAIALATMAPATVPKAVTWIVGGLALKASIAAIVFKAAVVIIDDHAECEARPTDIPHQPTTRHTLSQTIAEMERRLGGSS